MIRKKIGIHCIFWAVLIMTICLCFGVMSGSDAYAYGYESVQSVFLGGIPIGINAQSDFFVVSEIVNVIGKDGSYSPALQAGITKGDLIYSINGKTVNGISEFNEEVQKSDEVILSVNKNGTKEDITIKPMLDVSRNSKKIGMVIKNDISGMGTLTFVTKDKRFGALGHLISDEYDYGDIYSYGTIYDCAVTGLNLPKDNIPGELRGSVDFSEKEGQFEVNNFSGIYGTTDIDYSTFTEFEVAERESVTGGKAQILSTVDGKTPKLYDIEIIKATKQNVPADKSMVIRVTDPELKEKTGGILQGMSGSPIIQNGKFVGAVTHVFINDPAKGYAIYAEWMMKNIA